MVIFISGGITNVPDYQTQFNNMEQLLKERGHIVLNPAHYPKGLTNQDYMTLGFQMINSADAIMMLNGWLSSDGAGLEFAYAKYLKIPIFFEHNIKELDCFVNEHTQVTEFNIFDEKEVHENCTVEIWKNSYNGQVSVGWFENVDKWHKLDKNKWDYSNNKVLAYNSDSKEYFVGYIDYDIEDDSFVCEDDDCVIAYDVTHWRELDVPSID